MATSEEKAEKVKNLQLARAQIEKSFGTGAVMQLGEAPERKIDVIPSGSIMLDEALGVGGYPRGRIIEMFGPESSGKTTLALHAVAEAQAMNGIAVFIDAEHALDVSYAKNLGVNTDELWLSQPDSGEQALEITETLVRSGSVDIIVIDSVAALVPQKEIDGEMGDSMMGVQARLMSQALRKLTGIVSKTNCTIIFINQIRSKIGVVFGNPETTTGGNALKFYASVRLDIRRVEGISSKTEDEAVGNHVRVKVIKNKLASPFRKAELDIYFGKGISKAASLLDSAVKHGIIDKRGAWFTQGDNKIGQGRENAIAFIENDLEYQKNLDMQLRQMIFKKDEPQKEEPAPTPTKKKKKDAASGTPQNELPLTDMPGSEPAAGVQEPPPSVQDSSSPADNPPPSASQQ